MTSILKWAGFLAAVLLMAACFMPWVLIESRDYVFTGMDTTGSNYGKPGLIHLILAGLFIILHAVPKLWAKRTNLLVVALNTAWAIRNFIVITVCQGGECPVKKSGLLLALAMSALMLIAALFPDVKLTAAKKEE